MSGDAKNETLIPTLGFRWLMRRDGDLQNHTPHLQQRFLTPAGAEKWRDVPVVWDVK